jgi:hypothetical protein
MLFKDINDFKESFGGVQRNMEWKTWSPYVNEAEQFFIIPAIGVEFYTELSTLLNQTNPTITPHFKYVINLLKISLSAYTDFVGWFRSLLQTGDGGKTVAVPAQSQAPGKWLGLGARKDAINRADKALELALVYLEQNAEHFGTWKNSSAYTVSAKLFIPSAAELTESFPHASNSRRMYLQLKGYLKKAQEKKLKSVIGAELYSAWMTKRTTAIDTATENELEAWELAQGFVARTAVAEATPYLNISEDWRLIADFDGMQSESALSVDRRNEIALVESEAAENFKNQLINFLQEKASATVFPEYYASALYTSRQASPSKRFNNSKENKFCVL